MKKAVKAELYDWLSLFCTAVFAVYLVLLAKSDASIPWMNDVLLGITVFFGLLFIVKILFLNRKPNIETSQRINLAYKIVKYLLKILMLAVIVMGLVAAIKLDHRVVSVIISTVVSNLLFLLLLVCDTILLIHKRKALAA